MGGCSRLSVPCGKGVPQVMPAEIVNSCTLERSPPSLGIDLNNGVALIGKNMGWMVTFALFQHLHGRFIERYRMRLAILVLIRRHPQMTALNADLVPLQPGHIALPQAGSH